MKNPDKEDRIFAGFMACTITVMGILFLLIAVSLVVAMWKAGFINFVVWSAAITFIYYISKYVYHRLLESDWL